MQARGVSTMNKRRLAIGALLAAGIIVALVALGYLFRLPWTGLSSRTATGTISYKTAWDWLDLLIVPAALAILGFWLSSQEKRTERHVAEARAQSEALQAYLDRMSEMILERDLPKSVKADPVRTVARAQTLTALRQLSPLGRGVVLQFLYESKLIGTKADEGKTINPVVTLFGADFSGAQADGLDLQGADLRGVNLNNASLRGARLGDALLHGTKLRGADLKVGPFYAIDSLAYTDLLGANLSGADLTKATLEATLDRAVLDSAILEGTDFRDSRFGKVSLRGARLKAANLRAIPDLDLEQLALGQDLEEATLPNGSRTHKEQEVGLKIDELVYHNCSAKQFRISGVGRAFLNVLSARGSDSIIGMRIYWFHTENEGLAEGLSIQGVDNGEEYISQDGQEETVTEPTGTKVTATLDVPLYSPNEAKLHALRLLFHISLAQGGRIESASLTCDQFHCTDRHTNS